MFPIGSTDRARILDRAGASYAGGRLHRRAAVRLFLEDDTMNTYRVKISDRKNTRTISAPDPHAAIAAAVGSRFYSAWVDSWREDGSSAAYDVTMRAGRTLRGSTPVYQARAVVTLAIGAAP